MRCLAENDELGTRRFDYISFSFLSSRPHTRAAFPTGEDASLVREKGRLFWCIVITTDIRPNVITRAPYNML